MVGSGAGDEMEEEEEEAAAPGEEWYAWDRALLNMSEVISGRDAADEGTNSDLLVFLN